VTVFVVMAHLVFGLQYLYQSLVTLLYSIMYFILCANFDAVILTYCEQIGFILRSSRKYKFYLLFVCMGLFLVGLVVL
jgi:type III secretory pathway component EscU